MTIHLNRRSAVLWAVLAAAAAAASAQTSSSLQLTGRVREPTTLSVAGMRDFPAEHQLSFTQTRGTPGQQSATTVRGVRLAKLIERAGLAVDSGGDWKSLVVIATATDGYRALFSWAELSNSAVGDGVLVLYERDGRPLDAREGPLALLSTADWRLGPRHVRNLVRLEVRAVSE